MTDYNPTDTSSFFNMADPNPTDTSSFFNMADPNPDDTSSYFITADPNSIEAPYRKQYEDALRMYDEGQMDDCLEECKHHLNDPNLPRKYVIKSCILIVSALGDWFEAEPWFTAAEQCYRSTLELATEREDVPSLEALEKLRSDLDELHEFRLDDLTRLAKVENGPIPGEDYDTTQLENPMESEDLTEADDLMEGDDLMEADDLNHLMEWDDLMEEDVLTGEDAPMGLDALVGMDDLMGMDDLVERHDLLDTEDPIETIAEEVNALTLISARNPFGLILNISLNTHSPDRGVSNPIDKNGSEFDKGGAFHLQDFTKSPGTSNDCGRLSDLHWVQQIV